MNYTDPTGHSPYSPYLNVFDYYCIHKMVQKDILSQLGGVGAMEVGVKRAIGTVNGVPQYLRGRLDIYNTVTHEFYEVKHDTYKNRKAGEEQIKKYKESRIVNQEKFNYDGILIPGSTQYESQRTLVYGDHRITYDSADGNPALILYNTRYVGDPVQYRQVVTIVAAVVMIGLAIAFGGVAGGAIALGLCLSTM